MSQIAWKNLFDFHITSSIFERESPFRIRYVAKFFIYFALLVASSTHGGNELIASGEQLAVGPVECEQCEFGIELERDSDDADEGTSTSGLRQIATRHFSPKFELRAFDCSTFATPNPIRAPPVTLSFS